MREKRDDDKPAEWTLLTVAAEGSLEATAALPVFTVLALGRVVDCLPAGGLQ